jgi:GNAT superfamily N-acetyltransferase
VTEVLRRARRDDVPAIVRLLADDDLGRTREQTDGPVRDSYWTAFDAIDADPRQLLVVAEGDDGEVVGTLQLSFIPNMTFGGGTRAQIEGVRVDRSARGTGIGRRMVEWAIERAREQGCHLVQLTTNKARPDAHRFYEGLGFVASHEGMKLQL